MLDGWQTTLLSLYAPIPDLYKPRLRVVSNFGDGDCGARELHTRARAKFRGHATRREYRKLETTTKPGSLN